MTDVSEPIPSTLTLASEVAVPRVALGTWPMNDAEVEAAVLQAVDIGYRHVDTAENYQNEIGVGRGVRGCGLDRSEIFVTTKFNKKWHGDPAAGLAGNLARLGLDYVDLLLIHWPNPAQDLYVTAWEGMIALREQGLVRAIGTSNFTPAHLTRLIEATSVAPEVNQIELHPYLDRADARAFHAAHGIATEAWSPLGRGNGLLEEALVTGLAEKYGRTPGQIVLRWDIQLGLLTAPKSADRRRQADNLDIFGFALTQQEMDEITALSRPDVIAVDADVVGH